VVTLFVAAAWLSFRRLTHHGDQIRHYVALGVAMGLGLLTKATFLPLVIVLLGFLAYRLYQFRGDTIRARKSLVGIVTASAILISISGWWYLSKFFETGNPLGANDFVNAYTVGLTEAFGRPGFVKLFFSGLLNIILTFSWAGTWSFVEPPKAGVYLLVAIVAIVVIAHFKWLVGTKNRADWIPVLMLATFVVGLGYDVLAYIAAYGVAGTSGWYLHSFSAVFSFILGSAVATLGRARLFRQLASALFSVPDPVPLCNSLSRGADLLRMRPKDRFVGASWKPQLHGVMPGRHRSNV
jgi:hypothetical protein